MAKRLVKAKVKYNSKIKKKQALSKMIQMALPGCPAVLRGEKPGHIINPVVSIGF